MLCSVWCWSVPGEMWTLRGCSHCVHMWQPGLVFICDNLVRFSRREIKTNWISHCGFSKVFVWMWKMKLDGRREGGIWNELSDVKCDSWLHVGSTSPSTSSLSYFSWYEMSWLWIVIDGILGLTLCKLVGLVAHVHSRGRVIFVLPFFATKPPSPGIDLCIKCFIPPIFSKRLHMCVKNLALQDDLAKSVTSATKVACHDRNITKPNPVRW